MENTGFSFAPEVLITMEKIQKEAFNEEEVLQELKHYLPAQSALKDFVHHNTLHAFQNQKFHEGIAAASGIFGYKVSLSLDEFRSLYVSKKIREEILEKVISERKGVQSIQEWKQKLFTLKSDSNTLPRIGIIRSNWRRSYKIDLDSLVHPTLFRILCSYLDQGISIWNFPLWKNGFLASIKEMEQKSFSSFFKTKRVRNFLLKDSLEIKDLLKVLVGEESLYMHYLFDQQFAHQGWSGMVSAIENEPQTLLETRNISLKELIIFELLLEIDALEFELGKKWSPLRDIIISKPLELFAEVPETELSDVISIWQEAYEWSYYDEVLAGIISRKKSKAIHASAKTFQVMFCIDDRASSLRDYLEKSDPYCETFATPGFFNVEFFFQPEGGKFYTKQCPAPVTPRHLIKEMGGEGYQEKDIHFTKHSHSLLPGWIISQTIGYWSAVKLFINIFNPSVSPATSFSFNHMHKFSELTTENKKISDKENDLQIGFTIVEMAQRVEGLLKSIGLIKEFAPLVYVIGHGASSVNNPHYAAYDCGACSGRPGSVNAKVFSYMANHPQVREILKDKGINIPLETQFVGGLHDTTRDEICFYDEASLYLFNASHHQKNEEIFKKALDYNSKERARRFDTINIKLSPEKIHKKIRTRSVSLFEPRPELNHASNALCIVGRRDLTKDLFLDKRAFMNSYDYRIDPDGSYLYTILKAAAPVCGGINLEYFFSRVDNQKLGAGTKLPHNVMGLVGVANGIEGDLRPGLPSQMIEVHDPIRLLMVVEHFPQVVLDAIQRASETYEWFINEWLHLIVIHPETGKLSRFKDGSFYEYKPITTTVKTADATSLIESSSSLETISVHILS